MAEAPWEGRAQGLGEGRAQGLGEGKAQGRGEDRAQCPGEGAGKGFCIVVAEKTSFLVEENL